ncbi:hypothetical protein KEM48_000790 [Puccinia striiformis f. sp. tritici PST-130]|nr:hypothetical protein KEM48_000790 [Puccinia striiformis f. sp. tritici PST-130]
MSGSIEVTPHVDAPSEAGIAPQQTDVIDSDHRNALSKASIGPQQNQIQENDVPTVSYVSSELVVGAQKIETTEVPPASNNATTDPTVAPQETEPPTVAPPSPRIASSEPAVASHNIDAANVTPQTHDVPQANVAPQSNNTAPPTDVGPQAVDAPQNDVSSIGTIAVGKFSIMLLQIGMARNGIDLSKVDIQRIRLIIQGTNPPPFRTRELKVKDEDRPTSDAKPSCMCDSRSNNESTAFPPSPETINPVAPAARRGRSIAEEVKYTESVAESFIKYCRDYPATSEHELEGQVKFVYNVLSSSPIGAAIQERLFLKFMTS